MLNDLDEALKMRQDGATHEDGYLLADLDARVPSLPGLLALADSLEERQQSGNAQRRCHHGKRTRRRVTHVLIHVVNVRTHRRDHCRQASRLQSHEETTMYMHEQN